MPSSLRNAVKNAAKSTAITGRIVAVSNNLAVIALSNGGARLTGVSVVGECSVGKPVVVEYINGRPIAFSGGTSTSQANSSAVVVSSPAPTVGAGSSDSGNGGVISGWTIGEHGLIANTYKIALLSTGEIVIGDGNNIIILDSTHASYRFWAGNEDPTLAPFSITKEGAISATSGAVAGWSIDSSKIYKNNAHLSSTGYISFGTTPPAAYGEEGVWLGYNTAPKFSLYKNTSNYLKWDGTKLTMSAANFSISDAGLLTATNANISGTVTASAGAFTGSLTVGASSPYIIIDGANKEIRSTNWVNLTSGFIIRADGTAQFNQAELKGSILPTDLSHSVLINLGNDDHTQYLLANGTRALSGNMAVNTGVTIDGVDISAHAAATATAAHTTVGAHNHQTTANGGLIDHGAGITGLGDDDHSQYLNTTRHDTTTRHTLGTVVPHDDHGALSGLADDDHSQYLNTTRHDTTTRHALGTVVPHDDHGALSGLADDDHTQYLNTTRHDTTTRHTLGTVVPHDDHGALSGLADDDHSQYLNTTRHDTTTRHTLGTVVPHDSHAALSNLSADDHTQYLNSTRHNDTAHAAINHHALAGLGDDDHSQYLLANGTRALTGNMAVNAGVTIDGVDISAHAADATRHHNSGMSADDHTQYLLANGTRTLTGNMPVSAGITIDGVDISAHAAATAVAGHANVGAHDHSVAASGGRLDHGAILDGLGDDDHQQYLLANGTRTLTGNMAVSAGATIDGVDISAHAAATAVAGHASVGAHNHVLAADGGKIDHGAALDGLGDDDHGQYAAAEGSALTRRAYEAGRLNLSVVAGNGLTGGGLMTASKTLTLGTPSTINQASTNSVTSTSHSHQIDAVDNPGVSSFLLKSNTLGGLTLNHLGVGGACDPQFSVDVWGNLRAQGWIVGKHAIQVKDAKMIAHYDGKMAGGNITFNTTGHMGQVGTINGTVYGFPGKFGKAATFVNPITNLIPNPSFEGTYASGIAPYWSAYTYGAATGTRSESADALFGSKCQRVTKTDATADGFGVSNNEIINTGSATNTVSVWVKVLSYTEGAKLYIMAYRKSGFSAYVSPMPQITSADVGVWKKYSVTYTDSEANTNLRFYIAGRYQPIDFLVDGAMMVNGIQAVPYFDGSFPGCSWSGTANASTSSSAANGGYITYSSDLIPTRDGTMMCWFKCDSRYAVTGNTHTIWYHVGTGGLDYRAFIAHSDGKLSVQWGNFVYTTAVIANGTWYHLAAVRSGEAISVYLNGALIGTRPDGGVIAPTSAALHIGGINSSTYRYTLDGQIDDFAIIDRALSADEVKAIYESDAPVFAETSTWAWRNPSNLMWVDEEGMWMRDTAGNDTFGVVAVDGKTWGGFNNLEAGDIVMGNNRSGSSAMFFDRSTGKLGFYGGANSTVQVEIGTDGKMLADAGKIVIGASGIGIGATPPTGPTTGTGVWMDDSGFYGLASGTQKVKISAVDGKLTASDAVLSGSITAAAGSVISGVYMSNGTITADKLNVTSLSAISADMGSLTAGNIVIGSTNKLWLNDAGDGALNIGGATKASAPFRVTAAGALTATNATITGAITASSGSFAGTVSIASGGSLTAGAGRVVLDATNGVSLTNAAATEVVRIGNLNGNWGYASTKYGLAIGQYASNKANIVLDEDGTLKIRSYTTELLTAVADELSLTGRLTVLGTSSNISIGLAASCPKGPTIGTGVYIDRTGLYGVLAGVTKTALDATTGVLTATGADISGTVTALAGAIAGWTVDATSIYKSNVKISSSGSGYIALGATPPTAYEGFGIWIGYDAAPKMSLYSPTTTNYLKWDGAKLLVKATNFTLDASGNITATNATLSGSITAAAGSVISGVYLTDGTVTASKLNVVQGNPNLLFNSSFGGSVGTYNVPSGWGRYNGTTPPTYSVVNTGGVNNGAFVRASWVSNNSASMGIYTGSSVGGGVQGGWKVSTTYFVSFYAKGSATITSAPILFWNRPPLTTTWISQPALSTSWQRYIVKIVTKATSDVVELNGQLYIGVPASSGYGDLDIDHVQVEEGDYVTAWSPLPSEVDPGTITAASLNVSTLSTISADMGSLTAGNIVIGSTNKLWLNDSNDGALNIGGSTKASAPFRVTAAGALTATNATVAGAITASSGAFTGTVNITTGALAIGATGPAAGTGLWLDSTGLYGLNAGAYQVKVNAADGTLVAGGGRVVLDATKGVSLTNATPTEVARLGDLNGNWGYSSAKYGLAIGQYASNKANIVLDEDGTLKIRSYTTELLTAVADELSLTGRLTVLGTSSNISIGLADSCPKGPTIGTGVYIDRTGLYGVLAGVTKTTLSATTGLLTATGADISGTITASAGAIAGWTIDASSIYKSTVKISSAGSGSIAVGATPPTAYDDATNMGVWLGYSSGAKMSLKSSATSYLKWDGTKLLLKSAYTELNSTGNLIMTDSQITLTGAGAKIAIGAVTGKTAGTGIWIDSTGLFALNGGTAKASIDAATGLLSATGATISGALTATSGAFTGKVTVSAAAGAVAIGTTPPTSSSAGTGIWIDRTGLYGLTTGTKQAYIDASGVLYAGAGAVKLNEYGITIAGGTGTSNKITWEDSSAIPIGSLYAWNDAGGSNTVVWAGNSTYGLSAKTSLVAIQTDAHDSRVAVGPDGTIVTGTHITHCRLAVSNTSLVEKSVADTGGFSTVGGMRIGSVTTAPITNVLSTLNASSHPTNESNVSHFYSYGGYPRAMDARGNQYTLGDSAQIYLPLNSWYPSGAVLSILTNNPIVSFRDAQTDTIDTEFIVPMGWRYKTISVNIWWNSSVTTGDVVWNTELRKVNTGVAVQSSANLSATITSTVPSGNLIKKDTLAFADASGSLVEGQAVKIRLFRSGTNAADTMADSARVLAISVSAA